MNKTGILIFLLWGFFFSILPAQQPAVMGSYPSDGTKDIIRNVYISVALKLPNGGLDAKSVNNQSVVLYPTANPSLELPAFITFKNDLKNITLEPYSLLEMYTFYTFEITSKVKDVSGQSFEPYSITFFTGETAFRKMISMNRNKEFGESLAGKASEPDPEPEREVDITLTPEEERALLEVELAVLRHGAENFRPIEIPTFSNENKPTAPSAGIPTEIALLPAEMDLDELASLGKKISSGDLQVLASSTSRENRNNDPEPLSSMDTDLPQQMDTLAITARPVEVEPIDEAKGVATPYLKPISLSANIEKDEYKLSLSYPPIPYEIPLEESGIPIELLDQMAMTIHEEEDIEAGFEAGKTEKTEVKAGKTVKGVIRFPKSALPKGSSLPIEFTFNEREQIRFVLRTYGGDIIKKESGYLERGLHTRAVSLDGVEPGTYYAVVETTAQKVTKKIVILR